MAPCIRRLRSSESLEEAGSAIKEALELYSEDEPDAEIP
jgi:predicted RNase H-like HicB family nuclease